MATMETGARAGMAEFANLPVYIEPQIQTEERKIVRKLIEIPDDLLEAVDANVTASLPPGSRITDFIKHGTAYWTKTASINTVSVDGTPKDYFLKVTHTDVGKVNLRGEYESMKAADQILPGFVPKPVAVGTFASNPDAHFYLMEFVDMTGEIPEPERLCSKVAEMHQKCISPNGKFGFIVPTNMGATIQPNEWNNSWEDFFAKVLQRCFDWEQAMHGRHEEMQQLFASTRDKVIPRLLRPLETGGNEIRPCLVHGDLWDGNTSTNAETDEPLVFDGSSSYAHNEYELAPWTCSRHRIHREYIREYSALFPPSPPKDDYEDRLRLYALRFNLTSSGSYLSNLKFREISIEDMRYLVSKYPDGYQGNLSRKA